VEDVERNDGSLDKPYFMNRELLKILGKKNEKYREMKHQVKRAGKKTKKKKTDTTTGV